MVTEQPSEQLHPESLVARIIAELQANPQAQRLLLRALLTNEFLGMPARLDRIETEPRTDADLGRRGGGQSDVDAEDIRRSRESADTLAAVFGEEAVALVAGHRIDAADRDLAATAEVRCLEFPERF